MTEAAGLKVVTNRIEREAILAHPSVSRRLVGTPVNINNPDYIWLREPDGAAVFAKQGRSDYRLLAPTLEAVTPHNLLAHIFLDTDGTDVWFDRENEAGTVWGAVSAGVRLELTRNERGQNRPVNCRSRTAPDIRRRAVPCHCHIWG